MSYEEEQTDYRKQLSAINARIETLNTLFTSHPDARKNSNRDPKRDYYDLLLRTNYGFYSEMYDSSYTLEYKLCQYKKIELESKLKQTQNSRTVLKTLDYLDGITPNMSVEEFIKYKMEMDAEHFYYGFSLLMQL